MGRLIGHIKQLEMIYQELVSLYSTIDIKHLALIINRVNVCENKLNLIKPFTM